MALTLRPVDLDFFAAAPQRFDFVETVDAPIDAVFAAISADPSTWSWFPGLDEGRYESEPPHGAGSRRYVRMGDWWYRETLLAFDSPTRWAYRIDETTSPLFAALAEDWRLEADGDTTNVRWVFAFEPAGGPDAIDLSAIDTVIGPVFGEAMAGLSKALAG
ncbi:MAG TPA: SRPBCC family protein [Acidimicrobiia bacterium]|nr:SRPBCC family protein [Acidimicrobiia bacterium]